jgi:hypothetical protein
MTFKRCDRSRFKSWPIWRLVLSYLAKDISTDINKLSCYIKVQVHLILQRQVVCSWFPLWHALSVDVNVAGRSVRSRPWTGRGFVNISRVSVKSKSRILWWWSKYPYRSLGIWGLIRAGPWTGRRSSGLVSARAPRTTVDIMRVSNQWDRVFWRRPNDSRKVSRASVRCRQKPAMWLGTEPVMELMWWWSEWSKRWERRLG